MANRFYAPNESRAAKVHELFGAIAPRYDLINDLQSFGLHRHWKRQLVKWTQLRPGESALDLCCGTGDVSFALAKSGGTVVGLDFSLPMLIVAGDRARRLRLQTSNRGIADEPSSPKPPPTRDYVRIQFLRGNALRIPFQDSQFDVVTISYGLRNLENFQDGLSEIWRVLKPGGRLLVLDFGKPENAVWRKIYFTYLRCCVPWFGRLFCGDSETYAYILESLLHYPGQRGIAALMSETSYTDVRVINLLGGVMSINYGVKG